MDYRTLYLNGASVQISSFATENGCTELHLMIHSSAAGSFTKQLNEVHSAMDAVISDSCLGAVPIFIRYFLSDISNQAEELYRSLDERRCCAVSVIGQPPLDSSKIAMWVYLVTGAESSCCGNDLWASDYLGHTHLWLGSTSCTDVDSEKQIADLLDAYNEALDSKACSIAGNCLRTWIYVQDVDENYRGVVIGRRNMFDQIGLTKDTHYIASTGIAGRNELAGSVVTMDAYAVEGISKEDITYLKGSSHLNPTHEYGVTFERGTAVDFNDRRHVIISGTASINNKGEIVHPGDVCAQTERMWENISVLLSEAGSGYDDVMHMIVYLRDTADYAAVREMYDKRFPAHPKVFLWAPVCRPGWLVEMECIAVRKTA